MERWKPCWTVSSTSLLTERRSACGWHQLNGNYSLGKDLKTKRSRVVRHVCLSVMEFKCSWHFSLQIWRKHLICVPMLPAGIAVKRKTWWNKLLVMSLSTWPMEVIISIFQRKFISRTSIPAREREREKGKTTVSSLDLIPHYSPFYSCENLRTRVVLIEFSQMYRRRNRLCACVFFFCFLFDVCVCSSLNLSGRNTRMNESTCTWEHEK